MELWAIIVGLAIIGFVVWLGYRMPWLQHDEGEPRDEIVPPL